MTFSPSFKFLVFLSLGLYDVTINFLMQLIIFYVFMAGLHNYIVTFVTENNSFHWDSFCPNKLSAPVNYQHLSEINILINFFSSHRYLELWFSVLLNSVIQRDYPWSFSNFLSNHISYHCFPCSHNSSYTDLLAVLWL